MKFSLDEKAGFTLVELLIVVSILAVLAGVGIAILSGVGLSAKDQQKVRDFNTIKQALELYRSEKGGYPEVIVFGAALSSASPNRTYLNLVPNDPTTGRNYAYKAFGCSSSLCTSFILCANRQGDKAIAALSQCADPSLNLSCAGASGDCNMGLGSN